MSALIDRLDELKYSDDQIVDIVTAFIPYKHNATTHDLSGVLKKIGVDTKVILSIVDAALSPRN